MIKRIISGAMITLLTLAAIFLGKDVLWAALLIISLIGLFEFYRAVKLIGADKQKFVLCYPGFICTVIYYFVLRNSGSYEALFIQFLLWLLVMMGIYVMTYPRFIPSDVFSAAFGVFYVSVMLSTVYIVRSLDNGFYLVWLTLISSWGCDTCAYFVGSAIGKHKLAPVLSPKKSVEGAVGGVIGAALIGVGYAALIDYYLPQETAVNMLMAAFICAVAAVLSQVGDLTASGIKRYYNLDDYGRLIPGHGGILDRFDSVIVTAPVILIVVYLFGL